MVGGDKTTVSRLAARFWDINKGRITVGGMDVSKIDPEALICGGILTGIWMWSGHASASIISTPFCAHSFLNISPISFLNCPYISFLLCLYFSACF